MGWAVLVVLLVAVGGAAGWLASRAHPLAGPVSVVAVLIGATVAAFATAESISNPDARSIALAIFVFGIVVPLWVGLMATMTWAASRRAPIDGPRTFGLLALAMSAGFLVAAAWFGDGHLELAVPGLAHLVIAVVLCGVSWRRRRSSTSSQDDDPTGGDVQSARSLDGDLVDAGVAPLVARRQQPRSVADTEE